MRKSNLRDSKQNLRSAAVLGDRHQVFNERVDFPLTPHPARRNREMENNLKASAQANKRQASKQAKS